MIRSCQGSKFITLKLDNLRKENIRPASLMLTIFQGNPRADESSPSVYKPSI